MASSSWTGWGRRRLAGSAVGAATSLEQFLGSPPARLLSPSYSLRSPHLHFSKPSPAPSRSGLPSPLPPSPLFPIPPNALSSLSFPPDAHESMRITLTDRDPTGKTVWFKGIESMIAGAGAGLASSIITCPLDVIKTKLQAGGVKAARAGGLSGTFKTIWHQEGFRGLYRGLGPTIFGYLPTWAIYFTVYDKVKAHMGAIRGNDDPVAHVVAAMSAGATGTVVTNPLWVIKTRFMTQERVPGEERYRHTLDAIVRIYKSEGLPTFYRGMLPSLIGVSHIAVQFPLYEQLKVYYRPKDNSDIPSSTILFCSSTSKMIASVATYPHEVLRTRLQIQKHAVDTGTTAGDPHPYEGIGKTCKKIMRDEGAKGFYRGMGVNLLRTVPASAMTILTYEVMMRRLLALSHPHGED